MRQNSFRLARLLTMLPWLQTQKSLSVSEVARVFNISQKEVLADLALLTFVGPDQAGGGLVDIQYDEDEIKVIDPQGLETALVLNNYEILSLLMGLKTLQDLEIANPATFTAIEKLEKINQPEQKISPINYEINKSMENSQTLFIDYLSLGAGEASRREVEPYKIVVENGTLYLFAWCITSNGWRNFRLDRILTAKSGDKSIVPREPMQEKTPQGYEVEIEFDSSVRWLLDQFRVKVEGQAQDKIIVKMQVFSSQWFLQFISATAAKSLRIKIPKELKVEVTQEIQNTLTRLKMPV
jgi:proteasome accessory factor C